MLEAIKSVIRKWVGPTPALVIGPGILPDNDALATRVFKRMRGASEADDSPAIKNPHAFMLETAMDELMIDVNIAAARERLATLELIHKLPTRQRALLLDHIENGLTYKKLAKKHGLTNRVVLRDLTKAYSTIRMRSKCERSNAADLIGAVQSPADPVDAGVRPAALVVGRPGAIHPDRSPDRGVPTPRAEQQPDEGSDESGRAEHPATT